MPCRLKQAVCHELCTYLKKPCSAAPSSFCSLPSIFLRPSPTQVSSLLRCVEFLTTRPLASNRAAQLTYYPITSELVGSGSCFQCTNYQKSITGIVRGPWRSLISSAICSTTKHHRSTTNFHRMLPRIHRALQRGSIHRALQILCAFLENL